MSVTNEESRPLEGDNSLHQYQPGTGRRDNGPNIARPSNLPKEAGNLDFFFYVKFSNFK